MPAVVLQRYLLSATGAVTPIPASGSSQLVIQSANVPLGARWNIRLRQIAVGLGNQGSNQIQLSYIQGAWVIANAGVTQFFSVQCIQSPLMTPVYQFTSTGNVANVIGDPDQTISSLDQLGFIPTIVFAQGIVIANNADGAGPHNVALNLSAILEFDQIGTNE